VVALRSDGALDVVASDFWFCNGIAFDADEAVVVVERRGLQRVRADGAREWVVEDLGHGGGDGFCVDAAGRFYVASTVEHEIRVVEPDGAVVDFLALPGGGVTTNCCFGGDELRTLFATDAVPGSLVAWEGMPTAGKPLHRWPGLARAGG
jgi:gluconolactonase